MRRGGKDQKSKSHSIRQAGRKRLLDEIDKQDTDTYRLAVTEITSQNKTAVDIQWRHDKDNPK